MSFQTIANNFNTAWQSVSNTSAFLTVCELVKQDQQGREMAQSIQEDLGKHASINSTMYYQQ